jgi:hypothetical protein
MAEPPKSKRLLAACLVAALATTACSVESASGTDVNLRMTVWTADKAQLALFAGLPDSFRRVGKIRGVGCPKGGFHGIRPRHAADSQPSVAHYPEVQGSSRIFPATARASSAECASAASSSS